MRIQAALTICLTMSTFSAIAAEAPVVEVGRAAPDLELPAADGTSRSLAAADGITVLVFFRGLW
jgi:3-deoxy-D-arabino-heptulosonate 7-phosphate (DAHP) synthase class II